MSPCTRDPTMDWVGAGAEGSQRQHQRETPASHSRNRHADRVVTPRILDDLRQVTPHSPQRSHCKRPKDSLDLRYLQPLRFPKKKAASNLTSQSRYPSGSVSYFAQLPRHYPAKDAGEAVPFPVPKAPSGMAFLFSRSKQKTPLELVRSAKEQLKYLSKGDQVEEEPAATVLAPLLARMKLILQGSTGQSDPSHMHLGRPYQGAEAEAIPEQQFQLINALISEDALLPLVVNIQKFTFDGRKDTQFILSAAFRYKHPTAPAQEPIALHHILQSRPQIIIALCNGYEERESSGPCGIVLREALKYDAVAALILYDEKNDLSQPPNLAEVHTDEKAKGTGVFWNFFDWITQSKFSFEVSADAWNTFREVLTRHKEMVATWLETNYDMFFSKYSQKFLQSENYVVKRQSIKLLGELLLDRANYNVMTRYVESSENLRMCMTMLKDDRKMIAYETFHVFKVC